MEINYSKYLKELEQLSTRKYNTNVKALRLEFEQAKESYRYGPANTISMDFSHIIPLSYLAGLSFDHNQLISLVSDSRNIVLADSTNNRNLKAQIDWDLYNTHKVQVNDFIDDIISKKVPYAIESKRIYSSFMTSIETYLESNPVANYTKSEYPKLKDYINNFSGDKLYISDREFNNYLSFVQVIPSLSFYLQIFNLNFEQINKLFEANCFHMLLKFFNLPSAYQPIFKQYVSKYVTIPYIAEYYTWLVSTAKHLGVHRLMTEYMLSIGINKEKLAIHTKEYVLQMPKDQVNCFQKYTSLVDFCENSNQ